MKLLIAESMLSGESLLDLLLFYSLCWATRAGPCQLPAYLKMFEWKCEFLWNRFPTNIQSFCDIIYSRPHDWKRNVCGKQGRKAARGTCRSYKDCNFRSNFMNYQVDQKTGRKHFFVSYEFYIFLYSSFISFFYRLINLSLITNITDF